MPWARHIEPFFLVIKDEDESIFTVIGPMTDDTRWIRRVNAAQRQGRKVLCFDDKRLSSRERIIAETAETLGLCYTEEVFV